VPEVSARSPLDELSEGDLLVDENGHALRVTTLEYEVPGDGIEEGTVEYETLLTGTTRERDAEFAGGDLHEGRWRPLPDRVVKEPLAVLVEFASREVSNYTSRHGARHDYNGIDGIEIVADIRAADELVTHGEQNSRA